MALPRRAPARPRRGSEPAPPVPGPCRRLSLAALLPLLLATACGPSESAAGPSDLWTLQRNLARASAVEVAVPSTDFAAKLEERWTAIAPGDARHTVFRVLGKSAGRGTTRILVGTAADDVPAQLARRLGIGLVEGGGFRFLDRDYAAPGDAFVATLEDPRRAGMPLTLWFGNDLTELAAYLDDLRPHWRPGISIYSQGNLAYRAPLTPGGKLVEDEGVDYGARREERARRSGSVEVGGVRIWCADPPGAKRLAGYVQAMVSARAAVLRALDAQPKGKDEGPVVDVNLASVPSELSAITGTSALSHVNPVLKSVDALLGRGLPDDRGAAVARAAALAVAGEPAEPWMLDGIGTASSGAWYNQPLEEVVGALVDAGVVPSLEVIVDPAADRVLSPHLLGPLRGELMAYLLQDLGPGRLRSLWRGVRPWKIDRRMQTIWRESLERVAKGSQAAREAQDAARRERARKGAGVEGYRGGVCLVDTQGSGGSDYLDEDLSASLQRASDLGARSFVVSVSVPLFAGALGEEDSSPGVQSASASDLALFTAVARGRELGLSATLVIELLAADSGVRADQAALVTRDDWKRFFTAFLPVAQHYALLARLAGCDVLCLGSELGHATDTLAQEDEAPIAGELRAVRRNGWKAVLRVVRGVFPGLVTTCVRSPGAANQVSFWEDLDLVAVEVWPSFDSREGLQPSVQSLEHTYGLALRRYNRVAGEHDLPLLVMQAGFPATAGAWVSSWKPHGDPDDAAQALAYQALGEAVASALHDGMPLAGVDLWCWAIDAEAAARTHAYSPQGRASEELLQGLFLPSR